MDCRIEMSSTQYGTAVTSWASRAAHPCVNLENLCTSYNRPEFCRSCTHLGGSRLSPPSSSLTSRMAWGKRVMPVWEIVLLESRCHTLPPSMSYPRSLIMQRLVSRLTRTVASKGIWNAVRVHCVRMVGTSCLVWMACMISVTRISHSSASS